MKIAQLSFMTEIKNEGFSPDSKKSPEICHFTPTNNFSYSKNNTMVLAKWRCISQGNNTME